MKRPPRTGHWTEGASDFLGGVALLLVGIGVVIGGVLIAIIWGIIQLMS